MRCFKRATCHFVILAAVARLSVAQQPTPAPEAPPGPQSTLETQSPVPQSAPQPPATAPNTQTGNPQQPVNPSTAEQEKEIQKKEQSQRILGVVPQFGVTSRKKPPPLSTGQKFHLFVKGAFDPFEFAAAGLQAGISQANNEFPSYGQGAAGYGKRFGAALADQVSGGFFGTFAYPALLKEDPRYYRLGEGPVQRRIFYSLAQAFVTHADNGSRRFNYSNVLGTFSSGALSNAYYPQSDRGFSLTMSRCAISLLYDSTGNLIDEFWFDINQKLFHKNKNKPATSATPSPPTQDH